MAAYSVDCLAGRVASTIRPADFLADEFSPAKQQSPPTADCQKEKSASRVNMLEKRREFTKKSNWKLRFTASDEDQTTRIVKSIDKTV